MARNSFGLQAKCNDITTEDGCVITELKAKGEAFMEYNLVTCEEEDVLITGIPSRTTRRTSAGDQAIVRIRMALRKMKNSSTARPDGIRKRV